MQRVFADVLIGRIGKRLTHKHKSSPRRQAPIASQTPVPKKTPTEAVSDIVAIALAKALKHLMV